MGNKSSSSVVENGMVKTKSVLGVYWGLSKTGVGFYVTFKDACVLRARSGIWSGIGDVAVCKRRLILSHSDHKFKIVL